MVVPTGGGEPVTCDGCGAVVEDVDVATMVHPVPPQVSQRVYGQSNLIYIVCPRMPGGTWPCLDLALLADEMYLRIFLSHDDTENVMTGPANVKKITTQLDTAALLREELQRRLTRLKGKRTQGIITDYEYAAELERMVRVMASSNTDLKEALAELQAGGDDGA
jgi:hypothetical protein